MSQSVYIQLANVVSAFPKAYLKEDGSVPVTVTLKDGSVIEDTWFSLAVASNVSGEKESSIRTATQKDGLPKVKIGSPTKPAQICVSLELVKQFFANNGSGKESKVWVLKHLSEGEVAALVATYNAQHPDKQITYEKRYKQAE